MITELTQQNYEGELTWCGPCRAVGPLIDEIAEEYNGKIKVCKVNVDSEGALAAMNGIVSIPTVKLFVNGKQVESMVGARGIDEYEEMIEQYI